jgi:hypothetical protein
MCKYSRLLAIFQHDPMYEISMKMSIIQHDPGVGDHQQRRTVFALLGSIGMLRLTLRVRILTPQPPAKAAPRPPPQGRRPCRRRADAAAKAVPMGIVPAPGPGLVRADRNARAPWRHRPGRHRPARCHKGPFSPPSRGTIYLTTEAASTIMVVIGDDRRGFRHSKSCLL